MLQYARNLGFIFREITIWAFSGRNPTNAWSRGNLKTCIGDNDAFMFTRPLPGNAVRSYNTRESRFDIQSKHNQSLVSAEIIKKLEWTTYENLCLWWCFQVHEVEITLNMPTARLPLQTVSWRCSRLISCTYLVKLYPWKTFCEHFFPHSIQQTSRTQHPKLEYFNQHSQGMISSMDKKR